MTFAARFVPLLALMLLPFFSAAQLFTVTSSQDDGPGSLRATIEKANASVTGGFIRFDLDIGEERVIVLKSALPPVDAANITIDGSLGDGKVITLDGRKRLVGPALIFEQESSSYKNLDFINFIDPASFSDIEEGIFIQIYPNPLSKRLLSVEIDRLTETRIPILIEVLDVTGNTIGNKYTENSGKRLKTNIECKQRLEPGTYQISVRIRERSYSEPLVIPDPDADLGE